jgi:hypothetical protein
MATDMPLPSPLPLQCNQFGGQEPGSNASVKKFAQSSYGVTFPLFAKVDVNGGGGEGPGQVAGACACLPAPACLPVLPCAAR